MIVLNSKTFEELLQEASVDLEAVGFSASPGSVAKLFLNIVNKYIAQFYDTLTVNHLRAFVTTADGEALDAIGELLQCERIDEETDDNYRYRITRQCLTLATSNETAVRLAVLTTEGVEDCIVKELAMGSGSFAVIVLTNEDDTEGLCNQITQKLQDVHAYGVRFTVEVPRVTRIKITHKISISDMLSDAEKQEIRYAVQLALSQYFNTLKIGESIITDKITQVIMDVSSDIIEESNVNFYINGQKAIYTNQSCRWFERFALAGEPDNVVIL